MPTEARPRTYTNPLWPEGFADPFLLKVRGRYYAYATEDADQPTDGSWVFPILRSDDLVQWEAAGKAMPAIGAPYFRYWAPEVIEHQGRFLLYYAVHTGQFRAAIRVAVADRPDGPFLDSGHDLTGERFPWAIDPHVFQAPDGRRYLYFTVEYDDPAAGLVGTGNCVDVLLNPFTLSGRPARVLGPEQSWQLFEAARTEKGGADWYCVEGPAVLLHRNRYYQMYSGGCYYRENYAVSYATAGEPMGSGGMQDRSWRDHSVGPTGPLLRGVPGVAIGPGHNSVVLGPNNADLYIAYHAWPASMTGRQPCLDRLFWHGDALWTPAPTNTPQPLPARPRVRALCSPDRHDEPSWSISGGAWRRGDGDLVQGDAGVSSAQALCGEELGPAWLLEAHCRLLAGAGGCGLLLSTGQAGRLRLLIEAESHRLVAYEDDDAVAGEAALPSDFASEVWHRLLLAHAGEVTSVRLDGQSLLELAGRSLQGRFALLTEGCSAAFSAITLTDHFRDEFLDPRWTPAQLGWHPAGGNDGPGWEVRDGALEQTATDAGERRLCKGAASDRFEYGASLALRESAHEIPAYGLIAQHGEGARVIVWLQRAAGRWLLSVEGQDRASPLAELSLPPEFNPGAWHTLRLVRQGTELAVYLDGPLALVATVPGQPGGVGLATRGATAGFTGTWYTGHGPA